MTSQKNLPVSQAGQVVLTLVLVMTVALAIGISVVQRSLSDISTSTKVEQSSRAFSAAEAGIENKLSGGSGIVDFSDNGATASVSGGDLIPVIPSVGQRQDPLEYPPLAKEETATVWLADPNRDLPTCIAGAASNPPACYGQSTIDVYWGNSPSDRAALELTLVYYQSSQYKVQKWYLDQTTRTPANNFTIVSPPPVSDNCSGGNDLASGVSYQCKKTITFPVSSSLMLLRARLLYNTTSQPFAVQAVGTCGSACSIPPQVKILTSTGTSGATQRKVKVFQIEKVVPPYFDYAIFSSGEINKSD